MHGVQVGPKEDLAVKGTLVPLGVGGDTIGVEGGWTHAAGDKHARFSAARGQAAGAALVKGADEDGVARAVGSTVPAAALALSLSVTTPAHGELVCVHARQVIELAAAVALALKNLLSVRA